MMNNPFSPPPMCGGVSQQMDNDAPKEIKSRDMTLCSIDSAMAAGTSLNAPQQSAWFSHITVYAAKCDTGVFLLLHAYDRWGKREYKWKFIREDIFPELVKAVEENNLAQSNGKHSFAYGLPENFGGEVKVTYSSGEKIDYSSNQSPVISVSFALWLYDFFTDALNKEAVALPDTAKIKTIRFDSERNDGGYTHIALTQIDGVCSLKRERKYELSDVYKDEKEIPLELMDKFREIIGNNAMLVWHMLPESSFKGIEKKSMTFVFDDGSEIFVPSDRALPMPVSGAFFNIEIEMTT